MSRMGSIEAEIVAASGEGREVNFSDADLTWMLQYEKFDLLAVYGYDVDEVREMLAEEDESEDAPPPDYASMKVADLRIELESRQLPGDGTKDVLVARLEEDDAAKTGGE